MILQCGNRIYTDGVIPVLKSPFAANASANNNIECVCGTTFGRSGRSRARLCRNTIRTLDGGVSLTPAPSESMEPIRIHCRCVRLCCATAICLGNNAPDVRSVDVAAAAAVVAVESGADGESGCKQQLVRVRSVRTAARLMAGDSLGGRRTA